MGVDVRREWRLELPALHGFNIKLHDLFRPQNRRQWLLDKATEFLAEDNAADAAFNQWYQQRTNYFQREIYRNGNSSLRDASKPRPSEHYAWYHYPFGLNRSEVDAIPTTIRRAVYFTYQWDNRRRRERLIRERCFSDWTKDRNGKAIQYRFNAGAFHVSAWTPQELIEFDDTKRSHLPLPPANIGRDYTLAETCFALCVLHDADGGLEPFVPQNHLLCSFPRFFLWRASDRAGTSLNPASDSWVSSLETLMPPVESAMPKARNKPRKRGSGRPAAYDSKADNKIVADWKAESAKGVCKKDFAKSIGRTLKEVVGAQQRVSRKKGYRRAQIG